MGNNDPVLSMSSIGLSISFIYNGRGRMAVSGVDIAEF